MSKARTVVVKLLSAWQWTRRYRQPACRFYPSCSEYTRQAVEKHGIAAGMRLGIVRICKCHPFHDGGVDEVPETVRPLLAYLPIFAARGYLFRNARGSATLHPSLRPKPASRWRCEGF